jgi:xyloglucan-specific exo-beta-1,4-glucanase
LRLLGRRSNGVLTAAYDVQGDLWLAMGSGLYHAAGGSGGTQLTAVSGVTSAWGLAVGAQPGGEVFRSTDGGATWIRIDDAAHEYGYVDTIQADSRVFGRVYLGTGVRGIVYGDSAN